MSATVLYGKRDLVGIYVDGKLVATHDKFTKHNGDLEREIKKLEAAGHEIQEAQGDFRLFREIPTEYQTTTSTPEPEPEPESKKENPQGGENNPDAKRPTLSRNK